MAVKYCNDTYPRFCDDQKPNIDVACHDLGKEAGKWIMYTPKIPGPQCYCICSCVGVGTPVAVAGGEIRVEAIVARETEVLAAGLDLRFAPTKVDSISASAPGRTENTVYLSYTVGGTTRQLVVTMDHPFLILDRSGAKKIVGAGALQLDDRLVDAAGGPAQLTELRWGGYDAGFWEFATTMEPPNPNLDKHLVITGGVVTGDFAVTAFTNYPLELGTTDTGEDRPLIGSPAWRKRNAYEPAAEVLDVDGTCFTPAELHKVEIPAYASSFLPAAQAAALEEPDVPKRPVTEQYFLEECEWLIGKVFKPLYPDVEFLFDWYSDSPNAHSWVSSDDPLKRFVYLSGGLSRIEGFDYEGVAFALAHEIGHLLGKPIGANGVTCEGQADWYGASRVLRRLWFGIYYFDFTQRAHDQLALLYDYIGGGVPDELVDGLGAAYPSNACRLETVETAMASPVSPECAMCPEPGGEPS